MKKMIAGIAVFGTLLYASTLLPHAEKEVTKVEETSELKTSDSSSPVMKAKEAKLRSMTEAEKEEILAEFEKRGLTPLNMDEISDDTDVLYFDTMEEMDAFFEEADLGFEVKEDK